MTDQELVAGLRALHLERGDAPGTEIARAQLLTIPIERIAQRRAWSRPVTGHRLSWTAGAMRLTAAGLVLGAIGGLLATGPLAPRGDDRDVIGAANASPSAIPEATPEAGASASPKPPIDDPEGGAIDWDTSFITLAADSFEARTEDQTFTADRPVWAWSSYNGIFVAQCSDHDQEYDDCNWWQTTEPSAAPFTSLVLQARWFEKGARHHLWMLLLANEDEWFAEEVNYRRGTRDGRAWDEFQWEGPLFTTPLGQPFRGDVVLSDPDWAIGPHQREFRKRYGFPGDDVGTATLTFRNLTIDAYRPETLSAIETECQPLPPQAWSADVPNRDFFAEGEPLHGHEDILKMTPAEAKVLLDGLGVCYRFAYKVNWQEWEPSSDAERAFGRPGEYQEWCSAPPSGQILKVSESSVRVPDDPYEAGAIGVQVIDDARWPQQVQPPAGVDCPTMADTGASSSP